MRHILEKIVTAVLLLLGAAASTAEIKTMKIRSPNRDTIFLSKLNCPHTGYVSVAVSSVNLSSIPITSNSSSQPHDLSRMGFFLLTDDLDNRLYYTGYYRNGYYKPKDPDSCVLDLKFIPVLFTFRDLSPPPHSSFNNSYHLNAPGKYYLEFINCNELSLVTMDVRTQLYCTLDDGITRDCSSAGQLHPSLYFNFFFFYLCFLGFWINLYIH